MTSSDRYRVASQQERVTALNWMAMSCLFICLLVRPGFTYSQSTAALPLISFDHEPTNTQLSLNDATVKRLRQGLNHALKVAFGHQANRPSITFSMPAVDLSNYVGIAVDIKNLGSTSLALEAQCYTDDPAAVNITDGAKFYYRSMVVLEPGETDSLFITFSRSSASLPAYVQHSLKGMFGLPGGYVRRKENIDLRKISHISVFKQKSTRNDSVLISDIRAVGRYQLPDEAALKNGFFPFVDPFGQYAHKDWLHKTRTIGDIQGQKLAEEKELSTHPGAPDWDQYGGWQKGPTRQATGHFRVEKYQGKWWLVDPTGKLFWSQGINIVRTAQQTPTQDRENYFTKIPPNADFLGANLRLKYGISSNASLPDSVSVMIHKRLRSWGINTLAANSDPALYPYKKTPYTIEVRSGIASQMPDTLDETAFRNVLRSRLQRSDIVQAANDPWCIGYFVDNELAFPVRNAALIIDKYYRIVQQELKKFAPHKLYLGNRINSPNFNRLAFEASAAYCDVISINHYDYNVSDFIETRGLDKPVIIGEFHFGALDRGSLHPGLRSVSNQKQRGRVYTHFVNQALRSPIFVGVHWFQYAEQVCSGRNDGENYQIGFIDICDRPYDEMTAAGRKISTYLYTDRFNNTSHSDY